jgi:hypothetical protein
MVTLVFVAILLLAFALDLWVIRPLEKQRPSTDTSRADAALEFIVPRTLFFHPGHTWARLDDDGLATAGVDDVVCTAVGQNWSVEAPAAGTQNTAGEHSGLEHQV